MKEPAKFRFLRAWQNYRVGEIRPLIGIYPRDWLLKRKFIERVEDEPSELETATVVPDIEHAALRVEAPAPRKRGRPKGSKNKPKIGVSNE